MVWRELVDCGLGRDGCRGDERCGPVSGSISCIDHRGHWCYRLERVRRCRAEQLSPRIQNRLLAQRGTILLGRDHRLLRGMMTDLLLHRNSPRVRLEPAFPVAVEMVDPVLAWRGRLAGLRHALLSGGRSSRSSGFLGGGVEQVGQRVRKCRRRRGTCKDEKSRYAKAPMAGHGNSGVAPPATTFKPNLGRNATPENRNRSAADPAPVTKRQ